MDEGNLLHNIKFVKLVSVSDLPYAESIQKALRELGIGAVIINDERVQSRPDVERAHAIPPPEGFRIEVPEIMIEKARQALSEMQKAEEEA